MHAQLTREPNARAERRYPTNLVRLVRLIVAFEVGRNPGAVPPCVSARFDVQAVGLEPRGHKLWLVYTRPRGRKAIESATLYRAISAPSLGIVSTSRIDKSVIVHNLWRGQARSDVPRDMDHALVVDFGPRSGTPAVRPSTRSGTRLRRCDKSSSTTSHYAPAIITVWKQTRCPGKKKNAVLPNSCHEIQGRLELTLPSAHRRRHGWDMIKVRGALECGPARKHAHAETFYARILHMRVQAN